MAYSILVVDDEALTLRTIGRALQAEGYEVTVASSGEDAIKAFQEANGLEPSGEPNDELKEKLQSLHGR